MPKRARHPVGVPVAPVPTRDHVLDTGALQLQAEDFSTMVILRFLCSVLLHVAGSLTVRLHVNLSVARTGSAVRASAACVSASPAGSSSRAFVVDNRRMPCTVVAKRLLYRPV